MSSNPRPQRLFWVLATIYALVVLLTLDLTTAGLRRDGLAALPAMTLTLPTSLALMKLLEPLPAKRVVSGFIAEILASAVINIGIVYFVARWCGGAASRQQSRKAEATILGILDLSDTFGDESVRRLSDQRQHRSPDKRVRTTLANV